MQNTRDEYKVSFGHPRGFTKGLFASQVFNLFVLTALFVWIFGYAKMGWKEVYQQFHYHPLFMILGLIVFYGNAIIIFRVLRGRSKYWLKVVHATLNLLA